MLPSESDLQTWRERGVSEDSLSSFSWDDPETTVETLDDPEVLFPTAPEDAVEGRDLDPSAASNDHDLSHHGDSRQSHGSSSLLDEGTTTTQGSHLGNFPLVYNRLSEHSSQQPDNLPAQDYLRYAKRKYQRELIVTSRVYRSMYNQDFFALRQTASQTIADDLKRRALEQKMRIGKWTGECAHAGNVIPIKVFTLRRVEIINMISPPPTVRSGAVTAPDRTGGLNATVPLGSTYAKGFSVKISRCVGVISAK